MTTSVLQHLRTLVALAAGLVLAACASSPPKPEVDYKPDYDFSTVKRIGFFDESGQVSGDNPMQLSDIEIDRVDEALRHALELKGFEVVDDPAQADMLISWHLVTQFKTDIRTYNEPATYGPYYGYNRYAMYNCWSCGSRTEVVSRNYTEGHFTVDMIDPKLNKSVWRSTVNSKLKDEPQIRDQTKANEAAVRILADFPPGSGAFQ